MAEFKEEHYYVHSKNHEKRYHDNLKKEFDEWLKDSPVEYDVQLYQDEDVMITFKIKQKKDKD